MGWFQKKEYDKWASRAAASPPAAHLGLPAFDARARMLYGQLLPRGVLLPRLIPDRPPENRWMRPNELARHEFVPGQIILGKFAGRYIGHLDDRPLVTIAGARAGKTSTVLEPNLYLYPGSCVVLDPKGELSARTARLRRALGHDVYVLDPFGQSGEQSACFNPLAELDARQDTIVDDVASIAQAIIVADGDSRSKHWNDSARMLLQGILLLTLILPERERNLVSVRQLLSLSHPRLAQAEKKSSLDEYPPEEQAEFFTANRKRVEILLGAMAKIENRFGGELSAIGHRFLSTPLTERGSIFSTAAAQTDFLASLPLQSISIKSDFSLADAPQWRAPDDDLSLSAGRAHRKPLSLAAHDRAAGLSGLGGVGPLSARQAADLIHDGRIRHARAHGYHGAGGGVFSGLRRQIMGRAPGHHAIAALLRPQRRNVSGQCRFGSVLRQQR